MILYEKDFPSPALDPDVQEFESKRYGNDVVIVLRLSSGRLGVCGFQRAAHAIVDTLEEAIEAAKTIEFTRLKRSVDGEAPVANLSLEDLGI